MLRSGGKIVVFWKKDGGWLLLRCITVAIGIRCIIERNSQFDMNNFTYNSLLRR